MWFSVLKLQAAAALHLALTSTLVSAGVLLVSVKHLWESCMNVLMLTKRLMRQTLQEMTPENLEATVRRSSRNALAPKRFLYALEDENPIKKRVRASLLR